MRNKIAALALAALLGGLTACGDGAGEPSIVPEEPAVSVDPSRVQKGITPPEEPPVELPPEYGEAVLADGSISTGEGVEYYDFDYGFLEFPNEESFLSAFGFAGAPPFYEYSHTRQSSFWNEEKNGFVSVDQTELMSLYYNEEIGSGCAILDSFYDGQSHKRGVIFEETEQTVEPIGDDYAGFHWERCEMDYFALPDLGQDRVEDYQEYCEYDENGRISQLWSDGIYEAPGPEGPARNHVYSAEFTYDENGVLRYRSFGQSYYLFGTYQCSQYSYFDELGRVRYERCYITHGEEHYYYIYTGDSPSPTYCLYIDQGGSGTHFARY